MTAHQTGSWVAVGVVVVLVLAGLGLAGAPVVRAPAGMSAASSSPSAAPVSSATSPPSEPTGAAPPVAPPPTPLESEEHPAPASDRAAAVIAALTAKGISPRDVSPPNFAGIAANRPGSEKISLPYTTSPAPFGIGDVGLQNVSGTIVPYLTQTTSVSATFNTTMLRGYAADLSAPDEYGVQLNAVLTNVTLFGNSVYQFWTQNVMLYIPSNQSLVFVSNIWNFSSPSAAISCNVFYSAGGTLVCPQFYYSISRSIPATYPYSVHFWLNSTLNDGRDEVFFNYSVGSAAGEFGGSYDDAIFNSLATGGNPALTPVPEYQANGYHTSGLGLPLDFEVELVGPNGGSNLDVLLSVETYLTLTYLNATTGKYESVPSAYNVGADTGETSVGVLSDWASFRGCADCALLSNGPSFLYGLWNVSGAAAPLGAYADNPYALVYTHPMTAFAFLAEGSGVTNLSRFQWAPDYVEPGAGLVLPPGEYTVYVVAAEYDPTTFNIDITDACIADGCQSYTALTYDPSVGVYTPLWALNETAVAGISSGEDGYGNLVLYNNEYAPIGETPADSGYGAAYFPWFGAINDFLFPVFPGIYLNDTAGVDISNPPTFLTYFPSTSMNQLVLRLLGAPDWNDLQIYVQNSSDVDLVGGTIGGWFPAVSYYGPATSCASVTFWNDTHSEIEDLQFQTGAEALFLYGGTDNLVYGNMFTTSIPSSPNPYVTVAAYWGSIGLVDTDWGDAALYGADAWATCAVCDEVANNLFDTDITATQTYLDPYTGGVPNQFPLGFSQAYNGPYVPGTNILGGDYLGGNYWWDFGLGWNPYNVIPYAGLNPLPYLEGVSEEYAYICESIRAYCDYGGGDFYPLTYAPIYHVTFEEVGLPSGTEWGVGTYVDDAANLLLDLEAGILYNYTYAPDAVGLADPTGTYDYYPYSADTNYAARDGTFTVDGASLTVVVDFAAAYSLTITESGLPGGATWTVTVSGTGYENGTTTTYPSVTLFGLLPGTYNWTATAADGSAAVPSGGEVTVSGDSYVTVTFVPPYTVTVSESGLPTGTSWAFAYASAGGDYTGVVSSTAPSLTVSLPGVSYNWSATAAGYTATPSGGSLSLSGATSLSVTFAANDATGTLAGTISPASGTLYVDGASVPVGAGGSFSVSVVAGYHSVEVTSSGYAPYFNNVSVSAGETTNLVIALSALSAGLLGIGTLGWVLIGALAVVAVVLLVAALVFSRRARRPPPVAPFSPPGAAGAPPAPPSWQEPPPPPNAP